MSDGRAPRLAAIGLAAGVLSGLLGVGGGVVMVPLLVLAAGLSQHHAHATSLAAIVPIAAVAAARFAAAGEVEVADAALLALGAVVGAPVGARIMHGLGEASLKIAFGVLMVVVGGVMAWP
ncbi:MAG TPA: TSUP family transporter [Actinomycetota bacterium]|nr:TSUP family transporter [Actinomycetota bacterium]